MLVIEVARFGGPEVLVPAHSPDPVAGPGELVVAVTASDVIFLDTMIRAGRGPGFLPIRPPYVPGGGVAGEVASVGEGVADSWVGRTVIAHTGGPVGTGGYAEQAIASLDDTVLVPDGLSELDAAAVIHDGPTALRVARVADVRPGEYVLVLGAAGGMGILLVQLLRARGARVIGAARGQAKLGAVAAAGADFVLDYSHPGWASEVLNATEGTRPTVVLDGVGGQLGHDAYEIIADGGRFSAHGASSGSFAPIDPNDARQRNVLVTGIADLQIRPNDRADLARQILPEILSGRIRPLIGQTFPLTEAAQAHTLFENRDAIAKTLLTRYRSSSPVGPGLGAASSQEGHPPAFVIGLGSFEALTDQARESSDDSLIGVDDHVLDLRVGDGAVEDDGVPVLLIQVIARAHRLVLLAERDSHGWVALERDGRRDPLGREQGEDLAGHLVDVDARPKGLLLGCLGEPKRELG